MIERENFANVIWTRYAAPKTGGLNQIHIALFMRATRLIDPTELSMEIHKTDATFRSQRIDKNALKLHKALYRVFFLKLQ
jgi:hypothetical protein